MPNWLHKIKVHGLVVIYKINPSAESIYDELPFLRVFHYNVSALLIVFCDSHLQYLFLVCDFELFIDLIFNRESMTVPSKSSRNIVSCLRGISADDVFYCSCCNVPIMRSSSSEWWPIIESVGWEMLSLLQLFLKYINLFPVFQSLFFSIGKA